MCSPNLTSLQVYGVAGLMFEYVPLCAEVGGGCVRSSLVQTQFTMMSYLTEWLSNLSLGMSVQDNYSFKNDMLFLFLFGS